MASGWTDVGKQALLGWSYRGVTIPTNFFVALVADTTTPINDTNTVSDLTEVPAGNGYTSGGISLAKNATDFPVYTEDQTNHWGLIQVKDLVWTASGGNLPASGNGARWAVFTDDNVTVSARAVYHWFDLVSNRTVSDTQTLTLQACEIRIT